LEADGTQGYHSKRRLATSKDAGDPRLALIPGDWFAWKRVLDVGCNSGHITVEIGASCPYYLLAEPGLSGAQLSRSDRIA
jgi:hypothetical protein